VDPGDIISTIVSQFLKVWYMYFRFLQQQENVCVRAPMRRTQSH
jgi:hypothetical protein